MTGVVAQASSPGAIVMGGTKLDVIDTQPIPSAVEVAVPTRPVVRRALGHELIDVPVLGVLCFIGAAGGLRRKTRTIREVVAVWPTRLPELVTGAGPVAIEDVARHLRQALPPAVR